MLAKSKIGNYFKNRSREILENRMIYGFLHKKTNFTISKSFKKRWFLLVSAKSLGQQDSIILSETDFPPWMDSDTLYYYKQSNHPEMAPRKGIKMQPSIVIENRDMMKSKYKGFIFNMISDGISYEFMTDKEMDRVRWMDSLK